MSIEHWPIDRNNLHKYNGTDKRALIPDTRRSKQAEYLTDYNFMIVGPVDDTSNICMHAFSAELGHAVINTEEHPSLQFTVGTWLTANVLKLKDVQLDPIVWQVVAASPADAPLDQWGKIVEIVDSDNCIVETNGIVSHLTDNKHAVVFSDILYVMQTKAQMGLDETICNVHIEQLRRHPCVRVRARFSLEYLIDSWSVIEMTPAPHLSVQSDSLVTTDTVTWMKVTETNVVCMQCPRFGDVHYIYARYVCGHTAEMAKVGDKFRASFAPTNKNTKGGWVMVRATRLDTIFGSEKSINASWQLPHLSLNMVDSLPDLPLGDPEFRRTLVGRTVAQQLAEQQEALANIPIDYKEQIRQVKEVLEKSQEILVAMTKINPTLVRNILKQDE